MRWSDVGKGITIWCISLYLILWREKISIFTLFSHIIFKCV